MDLLNKLGMRKAFYKVPSKYNIWIINNNAIPASFFHEAIAKFFHLDNQEITLQINNLREKGYIRRGKFTHEIAENVIDEIKEFTQANGYKLKCIMCKDS